MHHQTIRRFWFACGLGLVLALPTAAQEALDVDAAQLYRAGPDAIAIDGVLIDAIRYRVTLTLDDTGAWRLTSVEPSENATMPSELVLDFTRLSIDATGSLIIRDIYIDGEFFSGMVDFDPALESVERVEFTRAEPPDPEQNALLERILSRYRDRSAATREPVAPSVARPERTTPALDTDRSATIQSTRDELAARIAGLSEQLAAMDQRAAERDAAVAATLGRIESQLRGGSFSALRDSAPVAGPSPIEVGPTVALQSARTRFTEHRGIDFRTGFGVTGDWRGGATTITQRNPNAFYAKLRFNETQDSRPRLYRVVMQALDSGWAGGGLHLHVNHVQRPRGYAHGQSMLVWVTRDPNRYGNHSTYIEIYHSWDDINMARVSIARVDAPLSQALAVEALFDPVTGYLTVAINGVERVRYRHEVPQGSSVEIALRALGRMRFDDLELRVLGPTIPGKG